MPTDMENDKAKHDNLVGLFDKLKAGTITSEEKDRILKILCQIILVDRNESE